MTPEEAVEIIKDAIKKPNTEDGYIRQALTMAIKALKSQSSDDCISREAVINELKLGYFSKELQEGKNDPCVIDAMVDWAIRSVKHQPSVTPQQKIGHWILHPKGIYAHLVCSKCLSSAPYDCETNYCPNCGAKMLEPQESEDKCKSCITKGCIFQSGIARSHCDFYKAESEE